MGVSPKERAHSVEDSELLFATLKSANTPFSLAQWLMFKYGEFSQLVTFEPSPLNYVDTYRFSIDYFCASFIRKNDWMHTGIDKREVALSKALQAEEKCAETNRRFSLRRFTLREEQLLSKLSRKIESIIGPSPPRDWSRHSGWGPGVTSTVKGDVTTGSKLREPQLSVTDRALPWLARELSLDFHWARARGIPVEGPFCAMPTEFKIVDSNRVVLVPKDAKTDRVIAAEPTGNIFLQKALGSIIRSRLARRGCDLNDQGINQSLAARAFDEGFCTIDLSNASDLMSRELIHDLLPIEWSLALDALRCKYSIFPNGKKVLLEKFSSMGNGFTFELESLIFFAATRVVCDDDEVTSVYGDDIIVPSHRYDAIVELLQLIGFIVNDKKSFKEGNFFESCGRHFFRGVDVTPVYQKKSIVHLSERIRCANRIFRWHERYFGVTIDKTPLCFSAPWRYLSDGVGFTLPPSSSEDTGVLRSDWRLYLRRRRGSKFLAVLKTIDRRVQAFHSDVLATTLRFGSGAVPFDGTVSVRSRPLSREGRRPVRSWDS